MIHSQQVKTQQNNKELTDLDPGQLFGYGTSQTLRVSAKPLLLATRRSRLGGGSSRSPLAANAECARGRVPVAWACG